MKKLLGVFVLLVIHGCGGKVVFVDPGGADGGGGSGGSGVTPPLCGGEVCGDGNQCCCGSCLTLDLPCQSPCDPPPSVCEPPYHGLSPEGNCVWSCGQGTQPDSLSNECVCQPGLIEVGTDEFGRRICG